MSPAKGAGPASGADEGDDATGSVPDRASERRRAGPVVTLDGPAGAGKSTTAKAVASALGYRHLDSGALYRALTLALVLRGVPDDAWASLGEADLRALDVSVDPGRDDFVVRVGGRPVSDELRTRQVTDRVSHLARLPAARACLLTIQRRAGEAGRLVADGRDMGTVVFPDADVKVYLVADLEERARRRLRQEGRADLDADAVRSESIAIEERDRRDSDRDISPLRKPDEAHEIDTTALSFDQQVAAIVALVRKTVGPAPHARGAEGPRPGPFHGGSR